jgi:hypothetical protein
LRYDETTIREEFNKLSLQEYGNSSMQDSNGTSSEKTELLEQLFHRGPRQPPGCANIDIQADLESCMKSYSRKCSMRGQRVIKHKATAMASQKGVTGVDFRKGLKASEE